jgi:hypothetical protein
MRRAFGRAVELVVTLARLPSGEDAGGRRADLGTGATPINPDRGYGPNSRCRPDTPNPLQNVMPPRERIRPALMFR